MNVPPGIPVLHSITGSAEAFTVRKMDTNFALTAHLADGRGLVRLPTTRAGLLVLIEQAANAMRDK